MARSTSIAALLVAVLSVAPAASQPVEHVLDPEATLGYWTSERYLGAAPVVPDRWQVTPTQVQHESLDLREQDTADFEFLAAPPTVNLTPDPSHRLFRPAPVLATEPALVTAPDVGQAKGHFTSSRLIPLEADLVYPYRAVGKLFFTVPGSGPGTGPAVCSGAVIAPRLVLTAGHCVHSGKSPTGFFTNIEFVPAFRDGVAPWGRWPAAAVVVTTTWATGQGKVPNAADYAVLEVQDLQATDGNIYRIGDVVGRFGVTINALKTNHVQMLGYPVALDNGNKMHQVSSSSLKYDQKTNTVTYGSDMTPGSSGGPWVQNFGIPAVGQTLTGGIAALNRIVGVMSFVSKSPLPKAGGSSVPDARLIALLNAACARRSGNC